MSAPTATGSCLCGAITFRIDGPMRQVVSCHCSQCRKTTGHHVAATAAKKSDVTVTGTPSWYRSSELAERGFCPTCGSNLFWRGAEGGVHLSIWAGALDTHPEGLRTVWHIFCADKGRYYEITDGLPQWDAGDDGPPDWIA